MYRQRFRENARIQPCENERFRWFSPKLTSINLSTGKVNIVRNFFSFLSTIINWLGSIFVHHNRLSQRKFFLLWQILLSSVLRFLLPLSTFFIIYYWECFRSFLAAFELNYEVSLSFFFIAVAKQNAPKWVACRDSNMGPTLSKAATLFILPRHNWLQLINW